MKRSQRRESTRSSRRDGTTISSYYDGSTTGSRRDGTTISSYDKETTRHVANRTARRANRLPRRRHPPTSTAHTVAAHASLAVVHEKQLRRHVRRVNIQRNWDNFLIWWTEDQIRRVQHRGVAARQTMTDLIAAAAGYVYSFPSEQGVQGRGPPVEEAPDIERYIAQRQVVYIVERYTIAFFLLHRLCRSVDRQQKLVSLLHWSDVAMQQSYGRAAQGAIIAEEDHWVNHCDEADTKRVRYRTVPVDVEPLVRDYRTMPVDVEPLVRDSPPTSLSPPSVPSPCPSFTSCISPSEHTIHIIHDHKVSDTTLCAHGACYAPEARNVCHAALEENTYVIHNHAPPPVSVCAHVDHTPCAATRVHHMKGAYCVGEHGVCAAPLGDQISAPVCTTMPARQRRGLFQPRVRRRHWTDAFDDVERPSRSEGHHTVMRRGEWRDDDQSMRREEDTEFEPGLPAKQRGPESPLSPSQPDGTLEDTERMRGDRARYTHVRTRQHVENTQSIHVSSTLRKSIGVQSPQWSVQSENLGRRIDTSGAWPDKPSEESKKRARDESPQRTSREASPSYWSSVRDGVLPYDHMADARPSATAEEHLSAHHSDKRPADVGSSVCWIGDCLSAAAPTDCRTSA
eukprot:GEMP01024575.1.p1 GENE.GEMP01024575.1~~GEMP01024575.1.p1  ORF type:complete len:625 (+),score=157.42 GEMP01024575.1:485-2359(+)